MKQSFNNVPGAPSDVPFRPRYGYSNMVQGSGNSVASYSDLPAPRWNGYNESPPQKNWYEAKVSAATRRGDFNINEQEAGDFYTRMYATSPYGIGGPKESGDTFTDTNSKQQKPEELPNVWGSGTYY